MTTTSATPRSGWTRIPRPRCAAPWTSCSDPMARALCWTALWDSARDAVTPAARYVDAVERFGPAETGIGVLLNVLGNASTAVERYVPRRPARRRAPRLPHHGRRTAARGSAGLRPATGLGPDPGRHQPLRRRPAGPAPGPPGRQHRDRRARRGRRTALESLACPGGPRPGHARSSSTQELARDNTAAGKSGPRHGPRRAPRGGRQGGRLGRRRPRHGAVQPAAQRHHRRVQHRRRPPCWPAFIDPYFECLEQVWADRSIEIASRIVRGLYPAAQDLDGRRRRRPTP